MEESPAPQDEASACAPAAAQAKGYLSKELVPNVAADVAQRGPESRYDELPVAEITSANHTVPEFLRLGAEELYARKDEIADALERHGFFVIAASPALQAKRKTLLDEIMAFFRLPMVEKMKSSQELVPSSTRVCGYDRLILNNIGSKLREKEYRDIFETHLERVDNIVWPSQAFKEAKLAMFEELYDVSVQVLLAVSSGIGISRKDALALIDTRTDAVGDSLPSFKEATDTNFAVFRYEDDQKRYTRKQRCMVHQDTGLVTLLPRATLPGIEILDPTRSFWMPMEAYTQDSDMIVYIGRTMEKISGGILQGTIHRVVREPKSERFSMPFELKPDKAVLLSVLSSTRPAILAKQEARRASVAAQRLAWDKDGKALPDWVVAMPPVSIWSCNSCKKHIPRQNFRHVRKDDCDLCPICYDKLPLASGPACDGESCKADFERSDSIRPIVEERPCMAEHLFLMVDMEKRVQAICREQGGISNSGGIDMTPADYEQVHAS